MKQGAFIPQPEVRAQLRAVMGDFTCREWQDWRWQARYSVRSLYLFQCDPVRGVGHFSTPLPFGVRLAEQLRAGLGGLSVPQFVVDLPGGGGKVPLQSSHIVSMTSRKVVLRGFRGERYHYINECP